MLVMVAAPTRRPSTLTAVSTQADRLSSAVRHQPGKQTIAREIEIGIVANDAMNGATDADENGPDRSRSRGSGSSALSGLPMAMVTAGSRQSGALDGLHILMTQRPWGRRGPRRH